MAEGQLPAKAQARKGNGEQGMQLIASLDKDQQSRFLELLANSMTLSTVGSGLHNKNIPGLLGTMQAYFRRDEDCYRSPFQEADKVLNVLQCEPLAELCLELLHISSAMDGAAKMVDCVRNHDCIEPDEEPFMLECASNHLKTAVIQLDRLAVGLRHRLAGLLKNEDA